jgi:hypothetical protein
MERDHQPNTALEPTATRALSFDVDMILGGHDCSRGRISGWLWLSFFR